MTKGLLSSSIRRSKIEMAFRGAPQGSAAADQRTSKVVDSSYRNHASKPSQRGSEFANSHMRPRNASEENIILKENSEELRRQYDELQSLYASVKEELDSKKLELSRCVPVPYGSYSGSGATPQLLQVYSEKVLIDLENFVLFFVPSGTPIEVANSFKARVSKILFSHFERSDFGVKGESLFTNPSLLPKESLTEFRAFSAYADYGEDEILKTYMPKYLRFSAFKRAKIQKYCDPEIQVELNDAADAHFCNLAMNVWMLHKLTLSFERATLILIRAARGEPFVEEFMESVGQHDEDLLKGKPPATTTVKHMMVPGLWINDSVIKCRVCLGSATGQEPGAAPATQLREGNAVNGTGPESVDTDVTHDEALQPTSSSQVPGREAPYAHAHQQMHGVRSNWRSPCFLGITFTTF